MGNMPLNSIKGQKSRAGGGGGGGQKFYRGERLGANVLWGQRSRGQLHSGMMSEVPLFILI